MPPLLLSRSGVAGRQGDSPKIQKTVDRPGFARSAARLAPTSSGRIRAGAVEIVWSFQGHCLPVETPDEQLVQRTVAGDRAAYGELARRWFRRILALCHSRLACRADAEDVAQETLLRGFQDLGRLQHPEHFGAWLRSIAIHACVDRVRSARLRPSRNGDAVLTVSSAEHPPERTAAAAEEQAAVLRHVQSLPEELREVILLHYYDAMTYDDMARWIGVARATVSDRLARGREILRRQLLTVGRTLHEV